MCHDISLWNKWQKFTFAQSKRFAPKHNLPVRGNNSLGQAVFWHEVKVMCRLPTAPFFYTVQAQLNITDQSSIICCCCFFIINLLFALFLFLFISHYFKKTVHGPGPWRGPWTRTMKVVHGPLVLFFSLPCIWACWKLRFKAWKLLRKEYKTACPVSQYVYSTTLSGIKNR